MATIVEPHRSIGMTESARRIWAIVGGSSGNLVEWYDFYVYSFTALYFASEFFPAGDRTTQLLNAAGIFGAGFLMRPIGSWLFGRIADRRGRRVSDKIGRRNSMLCFGIFTVLATVPILSALVHVTDPYAAFGWAILALAGVRFYSSVSGI